MFPVDFSSLLPLILESWPGVVLPLALHHMHIVNHHGISTLSEMSKEALKHTFGRHLCTFLLLQAFALHHKIFTMGTERGTLYQI